MTRRVNIALSAENFGFGPVSKVCAVAEQLSQLADVELVAFGDGLVAEFFGHEGYHVRSLANMTPNFDGVVVGLSPSLARRWHQIGVPVFYLDSLGFMWDPTYYRAELPQGVVSLYFCQDIFDSAHAVRANADWLPTVPVGAIVRTPAVPTQPRQIKSGFVFSLGGGKNMFSSAATIAYGDLVRPFIQESQDATETTVLCSCAAAPDLRLGAVSLPQSEAVSKLVQAVGVFASPGLTGLLECAALALRPVLLPPQNLSQFYIVHRLHRQQPDSRHLERLANLYPARHFDDEEEGVAYVAARNRELAESREHLGLFKNALRDPEGHCVSLDLCGRFDGAEQCARSILKRVISL